MTVVHPLLIIDVGNSSAVTSMSTGTRSLTSTKRGHGHCILVICVYVHIIVIMCLPRLVPQFFNVHAEKRAGLGDEVT